MDARSFRKGDTPNAVTDVIKSFLSETPNSYQEGVPIDEDRLSVLMPYQRPFLPQADPDGVVVTKYTLPQGQHGAKDVSPIPVVVTQYRLPPREATDQVAAGGVGRDDIPVMMTQFAFPSGVPGVGQRISNENSSSNSDKNSNSDNSSSTNSSALTTSSYSNLDRFQSSPQTQGHSELYHYTPTEHSQGISEAIPQEVITETTISYFNSSSPVNEDRREQEETKEQEKIEISTEEYSNDEFGQTPLDEYTDFRLLKPMSTLEMMVQEAIPERRIGLAEGSLTAVHLTSRSESLPHLICTQRFLLD